MDLYKRKHNLSYNLHQFISVLVIEENLVTDQEEVNKD